MLVANEGLGDYNPLGFIEGSAIELRFTKTRCEEFAALAVSHRVLWRDMPPSFAVDVRDNSVDDRIRNGPIDIVGIILAVRRTIRVE